MALVKYLSVLNPKLKNLTTTWGCCSGAASRIGRDMCTFRKHRTILCIVLIEGQTARCQGFAVVVAGRNGTNGIAVFVHERLQSHQQRFDGPRRIPRFYSNVKWMFGEFRYIPSQTNMKKQNIHRNRNTFLLSSKIDKLTRMVITHGQTQACVWFKSTGRCNHLKQRWTPKDTTKKSEVCQFLPIVYTSLPVWSNVLWCETIICSYLILNCEWSM